MLASLHTPLFIPCASAPSSQSHHQYDDSAPKAPSFFFLPLILVEYEPQGIPCDGGCRGCSGCGGSQRGISHSREEGGGGEGRLIFVSCQNPECAPQPWKDLACRTIALPLRGDGKSALECVEPAVSIAFASLFSDAFNGSLFDEILLHSTRPTSTWPTSVKAFSSSPACPLSLHRAFARSRDRFLVNFQRRAEVILNEPGPRRNCMPSEAQGRTRRRQTRAAAAARASPSPRSGTELWPESQI